MKGVTERTVYRMCEEGTRSILVYADDGDKVRYGTVRYGTVRYGTVRMHAQTTYEFHTNFNLSLHWIGSTV